MRLILQILPVNFQYPRFDNTMFKSNNIQFKVVAFLKLYIITIKCIRLTVICLLWHKEILPVTVTTDQRQLMQALAAIDISGGSDCPEMVVGAIQQALIASRPNSYIYVFTDARAKDYHLVNQVLPLIERKQSQVIHTKIVFYYKSCKLTFMV